MAPKISVITAVFNNEKSIRRAIESVLSQNYSNLEYIVIDGGSTDNTLSIINEYRPKIHQLVSERDRGIYDALNRGVSLATGDLIGFLHSDDEFASVDALSNIAQAFESSQTDGVYSDLEYVIRSENSAKVLRHWKSCPFETHLLAQGWMPPHPTLYLKKKVYEQAGAYNLKYPIAADYDFILRIFKSGNYRFQYLPQVTVQMQIGGASNRNLKKIIQKSSQDYEILKTHGFNAPFSLAQKNLSKIKQFIMRRSS